jgi:hypothetical protein
MPKFHLNVQGGGQTAEDKMGLDLPSLGDAKKAALALLNNAERASAASHYPIETVVITDQAGTELAVMERHGSGHGRPSRGAPTGES